jgi:hypothetical protein
MKRLAVVILGACALAGAQARPPEVPFALRMIDGGASETAPFAGPQQRSPSRHKSAGRASLR